MENNVSFAPAWAAAGGEDLLNAILDAPGIVAGVVELLDDDYRYVLANATTASVFGRRPGELDGVTARELGLPADLIEARLTVLRRCIETGRPVTREYPVSIAAIEPGWRLGTFAPVRTSPGAAPRVSYVVLDITARLRAQEIAEDQATRLALALDATGLGTRDYDPKADVVSWDARSRALFGAGADDRIDFQAYAASVHPDDFPALNAAYEAALAGANDGHFVVEHRTAPSTGRVRWVRGVGRVLFSSKGEVVRVLGTTQDITEQVAARERQDLLLGELNHRVKNNLATVQSIASHTLRAHGDDPKAFREAFKGRLFSLARGHDLITRNAWDRAELSEVFAAALTPFNLSAFRLEGPRGVIHLKPDLAVNLVMVLHELATNAVKYGALSHDDGRVRLSWAAEAGRLVAEWRETGGPAVSRPARTGFGSRLTASALRPFGGQATTEYAPEGVLCRMTLPVGGDVMLESTAFPPA